MDIGGQHGDRTGAGVACRTRRGAGWQRLLAGAVVITLLLTACGMGATPGPPGAATPSGGELRWSAFSDWLRRSAAAGKFSGAVLVTEDGAPVVSLAAGFADLAGNRPNTLATRFNIGSVGKVFTAVAIAQLAERGTLSFEKSIGTYLPGFPAKIGDAVTVAQLLTHTSGIVFTRQRSSTSTPLDIAEAMKGIVTEPLAFPPGSRFGYSNANYIVLGAIIEAVTGQSYYQYVRDHVFRPAGMDHTGWYAPDEVQDMAHSYLPAAGPGTPAGPKDTYPTGPPGNPSGGAYSTVGDLTQFVRALLAHQLLGPAITDTVLTGTVNTGRPGPAVLEYGYGFEDESINGVRIVGHGGGAPGIEAQLRAYPDLGCVVVILANLDRAARPVYDQINTILAG